MSFAETIGAELRRTAIRHPGFPAFHFHGHDRTYAEGEAESRRFARALLARGLRRGDRVALLLPPVPEYMFCYLGAARIGVITAGISTRYRRQEIREIIANADPRLIVTVGAVGDVEFPPPIEAARAQAPSLREVVHLDGTGPGTLTTLLADGDAAQVGLDEAEASVGGRDPIAIVYTSGTTGMPQGAVY